ncbi:unnamed protein product [Rotaria sordida]|uniref:Uncharacterized protein n=1 Tax=Rotaria sordida TaxID=392033 RepID=A0A815MCY9_9BILA|nr:unnamed protein product [Rotaria sordida]CAF1439103.1 unnamed protein product [Rotaria sordida]CAF1453307.1 unnamed protein product [Rotaria sordida]CAF3992330.1 unnamed protein product [Rotaria sordida]CAF4016588.1 unnamed protein product [Rotaria sordida]
MQSLYLRFVLQFIFIIHCIVNLILADNSSSYNHQCQLNWYYIPEETICIIFTTSQAGDISCSKKIHELEYDNQIYLDYIQRGAWIGNAKWSKDDLCDSTSTTIEDLQLNCIILTIRSNNQSLCLKRVSCAEKHPFICQS